MHRNHAAVGRQKKVIPLDSEQVDALFAKLPHRYRAMAVLAAGTGMRPAECRGLTMDRVDWLHRSATVDRQLIKSPGGVPVFGPPKTAASDRVSRSRTWFWSR